MPEPDTRNRVMLGPDQCRGTHHPPNKNGALINGEGVPPKQSMVSRFY